MTVTEGDTIQIDGEEGEWTVIDTKVRFEAVKDRFTHNKEADQLRRTLGEPIGTDENGEELYPAEPLMLCEKEDEWLVVPQCECYS